MSPACCEGRRLTCQGGRRHDGFGASWHLTLPQAALLDTQVQPLRPRPFPLPAWLEYMYSGSVQQACVRVRVGMHDGVQAA